MIEKDNLYRSIDEFVSEIRNYTEIDKSDPNIIETTDRIYKMFKNELLIGYKEDPKKFLKLFESDFDCSNPLVISNIPVKSLCEHHFLPFFGTAKITLKYSKNAKILGLSKFYRIVDNFSRRLQLQERLTNQIACFLKENLDIEYIKVELECQHMCVGIRGTNCINNTTYSVSEYGRE